MTENSSPKVYEVNFDGLIGPTHNYAGLAFGNMASASSQFATSHPKKAALEGLQKMKYLHSLGIKQGFIPPPLRPNMDVLKQQGYEGNVEEILSQVREEPNKLLEVSSASSMWTANAATVTPASDAIDGKVHLTVANLISHSHRSLEAEETFKTLQQIFKGEKFMIHAPLSDHASMFDEGAANHMLLNSHHGAEGIHIFVYGKEVSQDQGSLGPKQFPARQSLEASKEVVSNHQINDDRIVYLRQNPQAIDQGVFHNDVIATSNENVLIYHEEAYVETPKGIEEIQHKFKDVSDQPMHVIKVFTKQISIKDAVESYLFNSQIVTCLDGMVMIAPLESENGNARKVIDHILEQDNPIRQVCFVSLKESMANGGGPACLRLRVVLNEKQLNDVHPGYLLDVTKFTFLEKWIDQHYREELHLKDLSSVQLWEETKRAHQELMQFLS